MTFVLFLGLVLATYALQSKYIIPALAPWMDNRASYWKPLFAVYATGALFILMFGTPAIVIAAFKGGLVLSEGNPPLSPALVAQRSLGVANAVGLIFVAVRLGHDGLLVLMAGWLERRTVGSSSAEAPQATRSSNTTREANVREASELFHRLWGEAGTAKYDKSAWTRLQQLLNRLDVPV